MKAHYFYDPKIEKVNDEMFTTTIWFHSCGITIELGRIARESALETIKSARRIVESLEKKKPRVCFLWLITHLDMNLQTLLG